MSRLPLLSLDEIIGQSPRKTDTRKASDAQDSQTASDVETDPETLINAILEETQERIRLKSLRDSLLIKRAELKSDVEEINIRVNFLRSRKEPTPPKIRKKAEKMEKRLSVTELTMIPSSSFNFLPSDDWKDRLSMIRYFTPYLDIRQHEMNFDGDNTRTITFSAFSPLLFNVPLKLVLTSNNVVSCITVTRPSSLVTLSLLSSAVHHEIIHDLLENRKLTNLMYCLSSLSQTIQKRVLIMYDIIRKYPQFVHEARLRPLLGEEEISNDRQLYALLKTAENLSLEIPGNDHTFRLRLSWSITIGDQTTGECASSLTLVADNKGKVVDLSSLFSTLVVEHGVLGSLGTILRTSFGIDV